MNQEQMSKQTDQSGSNTLGQGREEGNNDEKVLDNRKSLPQDRSEANDKIVNEQEQEQIVNEQDEELQKGEPDENLQKVESDEDPNVNLKENDKDAGKINYAEEWNKNKPAM